MRSSLGARPLALIMLDLNRLSRFNDEFGHIAGGHVLCAVSQSLVNNVRPTGLVAGYRGEGFVVALPDTGTHGARLVAGHIREAVSRCRMKVSCRR